MIAALVFAALLQAGGPHFSEDPDAVATPGATQTAPAAPPTATAAPVRVVATPAQQMLAEENKEDPVSCQTIETTGTRFTQRNCLRKSQWDELARQGKETYEAWSSGGAIVPGH